jgi:hypothetical protein
LAKTAKPVTTPAPATTPVPTNPPVAPVDSPSSGAPPSPDASAGVTSEKSPESPTQEVAPDPSPDTYDWESWDGNSYDHFPEPVRPWMEKANGRYRTAHEKAMAEANEVKSIYEQLRDGLADPRVATLTSELEEIRKWREGAAKNFGELLENRNNLVKAIEERERKEAEEWAANFQAKHPDIFDGGKNQHTANELFDEGFDPEQLPELMKLPAPVLDRVRHHHKVLHADGVKNAGQHALALARAETLPPAPSESADMLSGAKAPNAGPTRQTKLPSDASLEERELAAVRRGLQR